MSGLLVHTERLDEGQYLGLLISVWQALTE